MAGAFERYARMRRVERRMRGRRKTRIDQEIVNLLG
jgi:hypothetical protein